MEQFSEMGEGNLNISDVIAVIEREENGGGQIIDDMQVENADEIAGNLMQPVSMQSVQSENTRPYIEILEQPSTGIRFRYEIEGRSAGSIPGQNSRPDIKTYPTIRIVGYTGKMFVVVSCVTVEEDPTKLPRPHPHKLVGRVEHCKNGVCRVELKGDNMTVSFPNLGIQCVKKKDVEGSLNEREKERVDPFNTGFRHKKNPTSIALNAVRLCFQGFIPRKENGRLRWEALDPVVSLPIIEKKATCNLLIHKLSHYTAPVAGGMEMILLCDKVPKEDIQIRFYEERDGLIVWEGYGDFQPTHVHHQHAIAFRTPKYDNTDIKEPVKVKIQLKLRSKDQVGPSLDFEMLPLANFEGIYKTKRKTPRDVVSEYSVQKPEKRLKTVDCNLLHNYNFIKSEPRQSPFHIPGGSLSPQPYPALGTSTSPQPSPNFKTYRPQDSPGRISPMEPMVYNIPFNQYQSNTTNRYEFPQANQLQTQSPSTVPVDQSINMIYQDTPPLEPYQPVVVTESTDDNSGRIVYQAPVNLNLRNADSNISVLDLDNQQYLGSGMQFGTSELINAVLDHKLSAELDQGLQISDPALEPGKATEQPSGMTDSLTRLTREIQNLNDMYKPSNSKT